MMNAFDFYYVVVSSTRKRDLLKGGIDPSNIRSLVSYVTVGRCRYPRTRYEATVGHVSAPEQNASEKAGVIQGEFSRKCSGATVSVKYHCAD